jgi:tRNA modification GTPase
VLAPTPNNPGALERDTIAAVATAPGRGGVGIVRISGRRSRAIGEAIAGALPPTRRAALRRFRDAQGADVDQGIVLFFAGPSSFTGEDIVELHGHGGPVVLDLLLDAALAAGARMARPGEFSERAFLNGRIDLAQAEAVADLIDSGSRAAARSAMRSLAGEFSNAVERLAREMLEIRLYVEAAIDFPEEEVDFLAESNVRARVARIQEALAEVRAKAGQGALLNEGMSVVIAGRPNAGKSSLLNRFAGYDRAIVTPIPGTTRDVLSERVVIDGLPLRIVDTAGLRPTADPVEQEGVRRARVELDQADRVLLVCDAAAAEDPLEIARAERLPTERLTIVLNKIDLTGAAPGAEASSTIPRIRISALSGAGMPDLVKHLKAAAGWRDDEGAFSARRRHLDALQRAQSLLEHGLSEFDASGAGELLAEDLRLAHDALGEIVGRVTSDDLLGHIFASFCIGK